MYVSPLASARQPDRIVVSRPPFVTNQPAVSPFATRPDPPAAAPSRITLGKRDDGGAVYGDPRAEQVAALIWSTPVGKDDAVSALMARNAATHSSTLGDQWRGLGGALLARFGKTGDDDSQTLVDDGINVAKDALAKVPPDERAQRAADIVARQTGELADVATNAATVGLTIQTRSGHSVALTIAVSDGENGSVSGTKVVLKASGAMTADERAAIAQMASGLDRALDGLGKDRDVGLDLSGLMGYDRSAIASVDLTANTPQTGHALGTFSLHLGNDNESLALKGSGGEIHMTVDADTPLGTAVGQQRDAAMQRMLDRMDSAGERGQASAALVLQMKSAFTQMQAAALLNGGDRNQATIGRRSTSADAPASATSIAASASTASAGATAGTAGTAASFIATAIADPTHAAQDAGSSAAVRLSTPTAHPAADAAVASQLSGLADFDVSFGGATHRLNRFGSVHQAGHFDDQLSQTTNTTIATDTANGHRSVSQTVSERLSADFVEASDPQGTLDAAVTAGNYSATRIRDNSTVTTFVDTNADRLALVLRKTDAQQLETVTDFENHRAVHTESSPSQASFAEQLPLRAVLP